MKPSAREQYIYHYVLGAKKPRNTKEKPMSYNQVTLVGRLGADPELRHASSGKAVTKMRVATDSGWGENKQTDWHTVVCFDKTAESAAKHLHKGRQVLIVGRVTYRRWERDDGTATWFTDIIAQRVQFLGGGGGQSGGESHGGQSGGNDFDDGFSDTDIPF